MPINSIACFSIRTSCLSWSREKAARTKHFKSLRHTNAVGESTSFSNAFSLVSAIIQFARTLHVCERRTAPPHSHGLPYPFVPVIFGIQTPSNWFIIHHLHTNINIIQPSTNNLFFSSTEQVKTILDRLEEIY